VGFQEQNSTKICFVVGVESPVVVN
jgi:hypothetical protein